MIRTKRDWIQNNAKVVMRMLMDIIANQNPSRKIKLELERVYDLVKAAHDKLDEDDYPNYQT